MPVPKAMGPQGSKRPAPASARVHSRSFAASDGQVLKPDGAMRPAASRGGHVPATPCVRALPRSAIRSTLTQPPRERILRQAVAVRLAERMRNVGGDEHRVIDGRGDGVAGPAAEIVGAGPQRASGVCSGSAFFNYFFLLKF